MYLDGNHSAKQSCTSSKFVKCEPAIRAPLNKTNENLKGLGLANKTRVVVDLISTC